MSDFLIFWYWILIIVASVSGTIESVYFIRSILGMDKNEGLRKGFILCFFASVFIIVSGVIVGYLGVTGATLENNSWMIVFLGFFFGGICWMIGSYTLMKSIKVIQKKKEENDV